MSSVLYELVKRWLHYLRIPVASDYLREKLLSHPDYPSLSSLTDTLDDLGIANAALQVDKEKLHELPIPFIAHVNSKGGDFVLVTNISKLFHKHPSFLEHWNGVILFAEKPVIFNHVENIKSLKEEKKKRQLKELVIVASIFLVAFSVFFQFSWFLAGLMITTITGLLISILIVQHEFGIRNSITEQLCTAGKNIDCATVLHSKKSRLFSWLNWADIGIIWFSSQFILVTISLLTGTLLSMIPFLCILSISTLPFTLFSIYYQWRVVKKWCTLCLLMIASLLIQFFMLVPFFREPFFSLKMGLLIIGVMGLISVGWVILKKIIKSRIQLDEKMHQLLRFKHNHNVFNSLLKRQTFADIASFENEIQLGNPEAKLQITVTSSLTCSPCSMAHEVIENILDKLGDEAGARIRFTIRSDGKDKNKMIKYVLEVLETYPSVDFKKRVLHDWYRDRDFEKFKALYPLSQSHPQAVESLILAFQNWTSDAEIISTPTVFINNRRLPAEYSIQDLEKVLHYFPKGFVNAEINVAAEV